MGKTLEQIQEEIATGKIDLQEYLKMAEKLHKDARIMGETLQSCDAHVLHAQSDGTNKSIQEAIITFFKERMEMERIPEIFMKKEAEDEVKPVSIILRLDFQLQQDDAAMSVPGVVFYLMQAHKGIKERMEAKKKLDTEEAKKEVEKLEAMIQEIEKLLRHLF